MECTINICGHISCFSWSNCRWPWIYVDIPIQEKNQGLLKKSTKSKTIDSSWLLSIVNKRMGETKDAHLTVMHESEYWINDILNQTIEAEKSNDWQNKKKDACEICGCMMQASVLQLHHIAGRKHDDRTITVCIPCHNHLSIKQTMWDRRWLLLENQSKDVILAFCCKVCMIYWS